jgi:hypothetical protein
MEVLVYDEVTKAWMTQASLDKLKKEREQKENK